MSTYCAVNVFIYSVLNVKALVGAFSVIMVIWNVILAEERERHSPSPCRAGLGCVRGLATHCTALWCRPHRVSGTMAWSRWCWDYQVLPILSWRRCWGCVEAADCGHGAITHRARPLQPSTLGPVNTAWCEGRASKNTEAVYCIMFMTSNPYLLMTKIILYIYSLVNQPNYTQLN